MISRGQSLKLRSRFITQMKIFLILAALVLIAVVIIWPLTNPVGKALKVTFSSATGEKSESTMNKPSFHGIDDKNQPFNLVAEQATQLDANNISLKKISGDIFLSDGKWIFLSSDTAKVSISQKIAELTGSVNIISDETYELKTESAEIDFKTAVIKGSQPVTLSGLAGVLTANSFEFDRNSYKFTFVGDVQLTIYTKNQKL